MGMLCINQGVYTSKITTLFYARHCEKHVARRGNIMLRIMPARSITKFMGELSGITAVYIHLTQWRETKRRNHLFAASYACPDRHCEERVARRGNLTAAM